MKQECLDHFIVLGQKHLNYVVSKYLAHYHDERPHQALGNVPFRFATQVPDDADRPVGCIVWRDRLGGLLNYYERWVA